MTTHVQLNALDLEELADLARWASIALPAVYTAETENGSMVPNPDRVAFLAFRMAQAMVDQTVKERDRMLKRKAGAVPAFDGTTGP